MWSKVTSCAFIFYSKYGNMGVNFDRWTFLKFVQVVFTIGCLAFKRVTDDEASRLFLYLQKISREWPLLSNVTWDRVGAAVADATYGGYVIITSALFIGHLLQELPTQTRFTEFVLLGVGTLLFIILGSLEFASLDSVPENLIDNAAILGTLSLITAVLFLLDMSGPKAKKSSPLPPLPKTPPRITLPSKPLIHITELPKSDQKIKSVIDLDIEVDKNKKLKHNKGHNNQPNGNLKYEKRIQTNDDSKNNKSFDIYGKDIKEMMEEEEDREIPQTEEHSPVWSKIRRGQYGKCDIISPTYLYPKPGKENKPSKPGDPGYVHFTAQHWENKGKINVSRPNPTPV